MSVAKVDRQLGKCSGKRPGRSKERARRKLRGKEIEVTELPQVTEADTRRPRKEKRMKSMGEKTSCFTKVGFGKGQCQVQCCAGKNAEAEYEDDVNADGQTTTCQGLEKHTDCQKGPPQDCCQEPSIGSTPTEFARPSRAVAWASATTTSSTTLAWSRLLAAEVR